MASSEERATRLREGLLGLGFLLLLAAAAFTVAVPELTKEPEGAPPSHEASKDTPPPEAVGPAPTR